MKTSNPKFRGTPGPWRVDGHVYRSGHVQYTVVSISGDAVGCAPVAEVLQYNPRPMPAERVEANVRLLAAAPDLLAELESLVETFDPGKQSIYSFAREQIDAAKQAIEHIYQSNRQ
ncbi:hypothetical protein [Alistipes sp.]|uniref:hypothetical protein n=1 Tax=Alistipes sp. TaxID=1872444 RepID=UPI003AF1041A